MVQIHNARTESINIKMNITSVDGGNFDITDDLVITANGYAVIGTRLSPSDNGGIENMAAIYSINDFRLASEDSIQIRLSDGTLLDEVVYADPDIFPIQRGYSMEAGSTDPTLNDSGFQWCMAQSTYGDGDYGTPGTENATCASMLELADIEVGELIISEIMHSPSMVYDYKGEWFELYNAREERLNIKGLSITAEDGDSFNITGRYCRGSRLCCYRFSKISDRQWWC